MTKLLYSDIKDYIRDDNKVGEGKEVTVYYYGDKVLKVFHKNRKSQLERISDEGLIKLSELDLNCFNCPIDFVIDDGQVIAYTEQFLKEEEFNKTNINFSLIKEDIITLSQNGFMIDDLFYNYIFSNNNIYFTDLTCYKYVPTNNSFVKDFLFKKNQEMMNNFLIGLLLFNAFKKGEKAEYTKIFKANEYRLMHYPDSFFNDNEIIRK